MASFNHKGIDVISALSGKTVHRITGHEVSVTSVAYAPGDGKQSVCRRGAYGSQWNIGIPETGRLDRHHKELLKANNQKETLEKQLESLSELSAYDLAVRDANVEDLARCAFPKHPGPQRRLWR